MTQQRAIKTRAGLIAAAAHEFADRGYAAASVNSILANSKFTKGALYFHFPSKEALAEAVLEYVQSVYTPIVERWHSEQAYPLDAIAGIVDDIAAVATGRPGRAEMKLALDPPPTGLQRPSHVWEAAIRDHAAKAERAGYLRPEFTAERFTNFLVATLAGNRIFAEMTPASSRQTDLADHFADTVETVIRAAATDEYLHAHAETGERTTPVD
ncbi:TetR/AcrR family transcriptional regulator [Rhodococcoides fascians]|uniref:TetR/AcrR family transcriptional regulator n=1 Tax=Rhodococcoides fascians TaxID=1828 RepID=UPI002787416A|nr:TetR/AcrR family transcriptional regulator [Rhodococcus fascians]MDQ0284796.1 AcrR family transcriptional regulator [Rhodococcus fascians]